MEADLTENFAQHILNANQLVAVNGGQYLSIYFLMIGKIECLRPGLGLNVSFPSSTNR
jgi:hypothetical protein